LQSRQRYSHDTLAQTVTSGWVAYSNALHIAGSLPILLGDQVFGGLAGRLLQMFLGVPHAELTMMALAASGEERQAEQQTQRRADLDRGTDEKEIAELERQLQEAKRGRDAASTVGGVVAEAIAQSEIIAKALARRIGAVEAATELGLTATELERAADDETATMLHMDHAIKAKRYFTGLDPVCCPRCQRPIDSDRRAREIDVGACSVCATQREQEEEATALAALEEAKRHAEEAKSVAEKARRRHNDALVALRTAENDWQSGGGSLRRSSNVAPAGILARTPRLLSRASRAGSRSGEPTSSRESRRIARTEACWTQPHAKRRSSVQRPRRISSRNSTARSSLSRNGWEFRTLSMSRCHSMRR
jgi:hypothetical protein